VRDGIGEPTTRKTAQCIFMHCAVFAACSRDDAALKRNETSASNNANSLVKRAVALLWSYTMT
jgi:hypothetical protein